jgi:hypothetical protein
MLWSWWLSCDWRGNELHWSTHCATTVCAATVSLLASGTSECESLLVFLFRQVRVWSVKIQAGASLLFWCSARVP